MSVILATISLAPLRAAFAALTPAFVLAAASWVLSTKGRVMSNAPVEDIDARLLLCNMRSVATMHMKTTASLRGEERMAFVIDMMFADAPDGRQAG